MAKSTPIENGDFTGYAKWASIQRPNTAYEHKWCIDVYPTEGTIKKLEKRGFNVKTDKEGKKFLHVKKKTMKADGSPNKQPTCSLEGEPFDGLIGNGSLVHVYFGYRDYTIRGNKGVATYLNHVDVIELVPFGDKKSAGTSFDDDAADDIPF